MPNDIAKSLYRYRDAKQQLWNNFFIDLNFDLREVEPIDSFQKIDELIFNSLVLFDLGISLNDNFRFGSTAIPEISLKQNSKIREINLHLRDYNPNKDADWQLVKFEWLEGMAIEFVEFFQWNKYAILCLSKIRGKVKSCTSHLELVGKEVIVECEYLAADTG